jgi:hypothetical protein
MNRWLLNAYSPTVFPSCSHKVPNDAPNKVPQASYHISPRVFFFFQFFDEATIGDRPKEEWAKFGYT